MSSICFVLFVLLIDWINKYRWKLWNGNDNIWRGCVTTLRTVLMTTLTYVLIDNFCPCFSNIAIAVLNFSFLLLSISLFYFRFCKKISWLLFFIAQHTKFDMQAITFTGIYSCVSFLLLKEKAKIYPLIFKSKKEQ